MAEGRTVISGARELRVKESDRIAGMAANLRLLGVELEEKEDGLIINGGKKIRGGATVESYGDHRIAMAMAIAGMAAAGETVIENTDCIETSFPGFEDKLKNVLEKDDA